MIGLLFACSVSAEVVHFECVVVMPGGEKQTWKMNIDMTEKVWETHFHTFSDVVITPSAVRASDRVPNGEYWIIKHS